jgi:hypothetical protein
VPYMDAVPFDVLLDITPGDFQPQQRILGDGPDMQLELLQVLEKMNKNTEVALAVAPSESNRGWRLLDRLTVLQGR